MKRVGIRLESLAAIIRDLENDEELRAIFGDPVTGHLAIVAEYADGAVDLRIEEIRDIPLNDDETTRFVEITDRIVYANIL
ncbi:hypothetical protein RJ40_00350 [Methanofollis aquaemaris]|uniref:Uncharacterized protein n=1 Tax=Methanofollis aquaemaris TaxID=126734 RepID=A0A8A3S287_9EURY|nr:hypothetical protein [Methanofollis aquaemaris]QSZ66059.1 hypothetical protein RJ40_00350 [Methanofollis aquaemaris]